MAKLMIDDKWIRVIERMNDDLGNRYTFCGALEYRYKHIAKNWNADTRRKHEREYNNIILPALKGHNEKTIREYSKQDFEEAIETIRENGYEQNGLRHQYSESSIHNFENLIYYVVYQASAYGLCDNVLWGTKFVIDVSAEEEEKESRVIIKKSLSPKQEKMLYVILTKDIAADGAVVALLLMWGLGLRNAEACGLNYGDIKKLEGYPDCNVAWIYKTTKIESRELQSGGKTYNTGRIVPVPETIVNYLNKRKKLLERIIEEQGKSVNIDDLPICNKGELVPGQNNYLLRCMSNEVSETAHTIFEEAEISPRQLAYLDAELSEENTAELLMEKDPTAYLLRRNFATHMNILGLEISEMQYLIGHNVEDAYESRNEYVDNDRIYAMYLKLKRRVLLNNIEEQENLEELSLAKRTLTKISISAEEPGDAIEVNIDSFDNKDICIQRFESIADPKHVRTTNVLLDYYKGYR